MGIEPYYISTSYVLLSRIHQNRFVFTLDLKYFFHFFFKFIESFYVI